MYIERSWGRWEGVQEIIRGGEEDAIIVAKGGEGGSVSLGKAKICKSMYWEWGCGGIE